jgi:hypothetical protein
MHKKPVFILTYTVLWNVTPCSLVSIYQATSQKTVVFPSHHRAKPTIHRCCNFVCIETGKQGNRLCISLCVCPLNVRKDGQSYYSSVGDQGHTGRIRIYSHFLLPRTPYLSWEISIYEPTDETIRTIEISRLSYCSLQHYIFIRWRLPSDVEVPPFFSG